MRMSWARLKDAWLGAWRNSGGDDGEVTSASHDLPWPLKGWTLDHGWWVDPRDWSFGVSTYSDLQKPGPLYPGRCGLGIEVGPFDWHIDLCQPVVMPESLRMKHASHQQVVLMTPDLHAPQHQPRQFWLDEVADFERRLMTPREYAEEIQRQREYADRRYTAGDPERLVDDYRPRQENEAIPLGYDRIVYLDNITGLTFAVLPDQNPESIDPGRYEAIGFGKAKS